MPYALLHNKDGSIRVENVDTGKVYSRHTSAKKAEAQVRLLRAIEHPEGRHAGGTYGTLRKRKV